MRKYPDWICGECGKKHGRRIPGLATYHTGKCDICKKKTSVTQPRDYGHLPEWGKKKIKHRYRDKVVWKKNILPMEKISVLQILNVFMEQPDDASITITVTRRVRISYNGKKEFRTDAHGFKRIKPRKKK